MELHKYFYQYISICYDDETYPKSILYLGRQEILLKRYLSPRLGHVSATNDCYYAPSDDEVSSESILEKVTF
jgi:hypothetical protein